MKTFFYSSLAATGFAAFQTLSFIATAYPNARGGCILLIILGFSAIAILGFANWVGIREQGYHYDNSHYFVGFAPAIALGIMAFTAIAFGFYSGN